MPDEVIELYRQELKILLSRCKTSEEEEAVKGWFGEYMMNVLLYRRLGAV